MQGDSCIRANRLCVDDTIEGGAELVSLNGYSFKAYADHMRSMSYHTHTHIHVHVPVHLMLYYYRTISLVIFYQQALVL
jgi:hypothetical protein